MRRAVHGARMFTHSSRQRKYVKFTNDHFFNKIIFTVLPSYYIHIRRQQLMHCVDKSILNQV